MYGYQKDRSWSDQLIPEMRRIIGPYLLAPSSLAVDRNEAADLIVLNGRNLTIACRVRRAGYGAGYADQFTIRSSRPSGARSELEKIAAGFGDLLFYGFADAEASAIKTWALVDLNAFRAHLIMSPGAIDQGERRNQDGTAFRWYRISSFPSKPSILIARSAPVVPAQERKPA